MSGKTEGITIKLDEPARNIPDGAAVTIIVLEEVASTYTIGERIAYLTYLYTLIRTKFSADVQADGVSEEVCRQYSKVLQWLLRSLNSIEDAYQFRTLLDLNELLQPFRTRLLKHLLTGSSITAEKIQEQLSAVAAVFAAWAQATAKPRACKPSQEHELYFLRLDEIRQDRLHHLDNKQALFKALDRAGRLELTGVEVGFFSEVRAAAVVRGERAIRRPHDIKSPATALTEAASA